MKPADFKEFRWYAFRRASAAATTTWTDTYFHTEAHHTGNAYIFRAQYEKAYVWDIFCIPVDIAFNRPTSNDPVATGIRPLIPSVPASTFTVSNTEGGSYVPYDGQWKNWDDIWIQVDESSYGGNTATKYAVKYPGQSSYDAYQTYSVPFRLTVSGDGIYGLRYYAFDEDVYEYEETKRESNVRFDKTAPSWSPGATTVTGDVGAVDIDWTDAPTDSASGVESVLLFRNILNNSGTSQFVAPVEPDETFYEDSGRFNLSVSGTDYFYWGRAKDKAGNIGSYNYFGSAQPINIPTEGLEGFAKVQSPYNTLATDDYWGVRFGFQYKIFSVVIDTGTLSGINQIAAIEYSTSGTSWTGVSNPTYNGAAVSFPFSISSDGVYTIQFTGQEDKEYWRVQFNTTCGTEIDEVVFLSFDAAHKFYGEEMRLQEGGAIWSGDYDASGDFSGDGTRLSSTGFQYYDDSTEIIRIGDTGEFLEEEAGRKGIAIGEVGDSLRYNTTDGLRVEGSNFIIKGGVIYADAMTISGFDWNNITNQPYIVSSINNVFNDEGNIDLIAGTNLTISGNDSLNQITLGLTKWLTSNTPVAITPDASGSAGSGTYAAKDDHVHGITCAAPGSIAPDDTAAEGSASYFARSDHTHGIVCAAPGTIVPDSSASEGGASYFARSNHIHGITCAAPGADSVGRSASSEGNSSYFARSNHYHKLDETEDYFWTDRHIFDSGLTISGTSTLLFDGNSGFKSGGTDVINVIDGDAIRSSDYTADQQGWAIDSNGTAEFANGKFRGSLHATILTYDEKHAVSGTLYVSPSAGKLLNDFTSVSSPTTFNIDIEDPPAGHAQIFDEYEILVIRAPYSGGVQENWFSVSSISNEATFYRYVCTLLNGTPGTFYAGSAVISFGRSWDWEDVLEHWEDTAINWEDASTPCIIKISSDETNAPYIDIFSHHGAPWSSLTSYVRLGNLKGTADYTAKTYGLAAAKDISATPGSGFEGFTLDHINGLRLFNLDIAQYTGANQTVDIDNSGNLKLGINLSADATTSFDFNATTGALRVGELAASHANMYWADGALQLRKNTTVVHELDVSGNVRFGEVGSGKSNLYFDAATGNLQLRNDTTAKITLSSAGNISLLGNLQIGTAGALYSGQTAWNTGTGYWFEYNTGTPRMSLGNSSGQYLTLDGTNMAYKGTITITSGSGIANLSDAGDLAVEDDLDGVPDGSTYYRTTANQRDGGGRAYTAIDASNNLVTAAMGGAVAPVSGAGLYLGSDYMGFYDGGLWDTYMDSSGNFYLGGSGGHLQWAAATNDLTISGTVYADAGYFGSGNTVVAIENGGLNVGALGHIRGGQTDYDTGVGFWEGYSGGAYKKSIGNSAGEKLTWDGSIVTIQGTLQTASANQRIVLSSTDNNMIWYDSGGTEAIRIDDSIWGAVPGIKLTNGVFYVYGNADNYGYWAAIPAETVLNLCSTCAGGQPIIAAYTHGAFPGNTSAIVGQTNVSDASVAGADRTGLTGQAIITNIENDDNPTGVYGTASTTGSGTPYSGKFTAAPVFVGDKIIFTQTDGNEYIDSLADGYLDIYATTAVRFVSTDHILKLGDAAGTDKVYVHDSGGATVHSIDSDGNSSAVGTAMAKGNYLAEGYSTGRCVLRASRIDFQPGATPGTNINCTHWTAGGSPFSWNPATITSGTNIAKEGTSGSFTLNDDGTMITIDPTEQVVAVLGVTIHMHKLNTASAEMFLVGAYPSSGNMIINVRLRDAVPVDWTTILDADDILIVQIAYMTST